MYFDILWINEKDTLIVSLLHCSYVYFKILYEIWDIPWISGEVTGAIHMCENAKVEGILCFFTGKFPGNNVVHLGPDDMSVGALLPFSTVEEAGNRKNDDDIDN